MITFRHTASAIVLSSLLVLGGCKNNSESDDTAMGTLSVKTADAKILKKMLDVEDRNVSEAEAEEALSELGMSTKSGGLDWDSKQGSSGNYHYKNLNFKSDDGENITIADVKLDGVHMDGDDATFDRMTLSKVTINDEDTSGTIESLILSRPNPATAAKILKSINNIDSLKDLDLDFKVDGDFSFGAILLQGMDVKDEDATVKIETLGWGSDETTGKGAFLAKNIDINAMDDDLETPIMISLASASATDISAALMSQIKSGEKDGMASNLNPFQSGYGNFQLDDFKLSADVLSVSLEGVQMQSTTKGKITTEQQVLKPLRIGFLGEASDPQLMEAQKALSSLGFETLEFTGRSTKIFDAAKDTMVVKDSNLSLKDGFNLTYDVEASGIGAVAEAAKSGQTGTDLSSLDALKFNRIKFEFTDQSIVDKAFNFAAEMQGTNPALVKMQAKGALMFLPAMAKGPEQTQIFTEVAESTGKLLDNGGTLTIAINPSSPITMSDIQSLVSSPDKKMDQLGLSVGHRK